MILAIDTSLGTAVGIIDAVISEVPRAPRSEQASQNRLGHAEVIGELLEAALAEAGDTAGLTHVAAGMGPGPFTGLRVGIAAARAFAWGRGIPVIPVVSHDGIALDMLIERPEAPRFAVVTDARRREFAYTVYEGLDAAGLPVQVTGPALIPRDDLDARLGELHAERRDADEVSAAMLALVAFRTLQAGRDVVSGEPLYLRSPDVTLSHGPKRVTA